MRHFSWSYFTKTGDVDAFMLYKEVDALALSESETGSVIADVLEEVPELAETSDGV
ncbi:putative YqzL family protein [Paenibacillus sp. 598K]|uniref:YqzL family protein n=1 Tax=Paenibacillus sp. 598K TaxID=1117987 RepID=UPI000FF9DDA4|nr:YqzL family protein [Paenibacillus sp. 598K]GBF75429.1 putative YqzL family protein [Paenibacillus sp. 598K]